MSKPRLVLVPEEPFDLLTVSGRVELGLLGELEGRGVALSLIAVLGGDPESAGTDPRSAARVVGELAQSAVLRRNGDVLAAAIRTTRMASAGTAA
jgi:hypothetical protein